MSGNDWTRAIYLGLLAAYFLDWSIEGVFLVFKTFSTDVVGRTSMLWCKYRLFFSYL